LKAEGGAPFRVAAGCQSSAVLLYDRPADRESHAHAVLLGGEEGAEQAFGVAVRKSDAAVAHLDDDVCALLPTVDTDLPMIHRSMLHRLLGVDDQIDQHLVELVAVALDRRQAAAEWFPRLFLNALFGREDVEMNGMSLGAARFSNVAGLLVMPIFNAGRTRSINEIAESNQSVALLRYEDGIVRALEDVENTLVAVADERRRTEQLESAAASAEAALGRAQSLYERGQIDMLPLLDAQRTRLAVRVSANDSRTQLLLDTVQLYKALGGGWQVFEPAVKPAAADEKHAPRS